MGFKDSIPVSSRSIYTSTDIAIDMKDFALETFIYCSWTFAANAAKVFADADVSVADNTITIAGHGQTTGMVGQLTTTGVLPAGLAPLTDYYIIRVSADVFKLAASAADAAAGVAVDITGAAGGGNHTFTPAANAGTLKYWLSPDGTTKALAIDATGKNMAAVAVYGEQKEIASKYLIIEAAVSGGVATFSGVVQGYKGNL